MKIVASIMLALVAVLAAVPSAHANVKQLKVYRKVFPDYKPKCGYCHVDDKPKKDDGKHDLNAYGLKLQELMHGEELTEDMVRELGNHEDFEAAAEGADDMSSLSPTGDDGEPTVETARLVAETKELVEETKEMVSDTQEMVRQTRDVVNEAAAATEEVKLILAEKSPDYARNTTQQVAGE